MRNKKQNSDAKKSETRSDKKRAYNSRSMQERRARIISATLSLIEEEGLNSVTIRSVSKRAEVALRTLYLYFENREAMIAAAINEFFHESISANGPDIEPTNLEELLDRFDRLSEIIMRHRAYSSALAPIYFSPFLDNHIYRVLKNIALSHVSEFAKNAVSKQPNPISESELHFLLDQIANIEFAVINDVLSNRIADQNLSACLKISVLSFIVGFLPNPPQELKAGLKKLLRDSPLSKNPAEDD